MQVPAVMFIETAADILKRMPDKALEDERRELNSFGDARAQQLGASRLSGDFVVGYLLGLYTARVMLTGSVQLAKAGINPDSLL